MSEKSADSVARDLLAEHNAQAREAAEASFAALCKRFGIEAARDAFLAVLDQNKRPKHRPSAGDDLEVTARRLLLAQHARDYQSDHPNCDVAEIARHYYERHGGQSYDAVEQDMRRVLKLYPIKNGDIKWTV